MSCAGVQPDSTCYCGTANGAPSNAWAGREDCKHGCSVDMKYAWKLDKYDWKLQNLISGIIIFDKQNIIK